MSKFIRRRCPRFENPAGLLAPRRDGLRIIIIAEHCQHMIDVCYPSGDLTAALVGLGKLTRQFTPLLHQRRDDMRFRHAL